MSIPNFYGTMEGLNAFSQELGLDEIKWEPRESQYVSQPYEREKARAIANIMAKALGLDGSDVVSAFKSRTTDGMRVVIWDIPRFAQALGKYQVTAQMKGELGEIHQAAVSRLKANLMADLETHAMTKEKLQQLEEKEESHRKAVLKIKAGLGMVQKQSTKEEVRQKGEKEEKTPVNQNLEWKADLKELRADPKALRPDLRRI